MNQNETWRTTFAIVCWHIWRIRNVVVFQKCSHHHSSNFNKFLNDVAANYVTFQGKGKKIVVIPDEPVRWTAPPDGCFKLNTDGSWKEGNVATGGGAIRKDNGAWVVGFSFKAKARKPVEAELLAVRQGLELARTYGITNLQVEVDAKALMGMLKYVDSHLSHPLGAVIYEVSSIIKSTNGIEIAHVARDANMLADALARLGWEMDEEFIIHNAVPRPAMDAFNQDLRGLNLV